MPEGNSLRQNVNEAGFREPGLLRHLELHALTFGQAAESVSLDGGVMDEDVLAALALDKTKTLGIVKPLHCSLFHVQVHFFLLLMLRRIRAGSYYRAGTASFRRELAQTSVSNLNASAV